MMVSDAALMYMSDNLLVSNVFSPIIAILCVGLLLMFLIIFFQALWKNRKSYDYRKILADMFVASKIRQLAEKEDLDIEEEMKRFSKIKRLDKISEKDLDSTIEMDLQEKVTKEAFEELEKSKKSE